MTAMAFPLGNPQRRNRWIAIIAAGLFLAVGGVALERYSVASHQAEERARVDDQLRAVAARLEGNVLARDQLLRGLSAAVQTDDGLSQERFDVFASTLTANYPDIRNIAAAPDFRVEYVYPYAPNSSVLGFEYPGTTQWPAIERSLQTGRQVLIGPIDLIQGGKGYILRHPIFAAGETRPDRAWGVLSLVLDAQAFMQGVGLNDPDLNLRLAVNAPEAPAESGLIYGETSVFEADPQVVNVALPFANWQLAGLPKDGWSQRLPNHGYYILAYAAVAAALLVLLDLLMSFSQKKRQAEERLANAIDAIDDGFALYDADGRFVTCNQRYRELYHLSADLFVPGAKFSDILATGIARGQYPEAIGREEEWLASRLDAHNDPETEVVQRLPNGRWLKISERVSSDGSIVGFRVDITELKRAQETAEAASRAKTDFINMLSHELRTPMTVVLGYASILANRQLFAAARRADQVLDAETIDPEALEAQTRKLIDEVVNFGVKIEQSGGRLLSLINELLDFSKIESGHIDITTADFDMAETARGICEQFEVLAERKGLGISCDMPQLMALGDRKRCEQVLNNLVGNAIKFTETGSITITGERDGDEIIVRVTDTGVGIAPEMQDLVFQEFQQADSSCTRNAGGTGLGLAIVKRVVELQGGRVWLESVPGQGTMVAFSLPAVMEIAKARLKILNS